MRLSSLLIWIIGITAVTAKRNRPEARSTVDLVITAYQSLSELYIDGVKLTLTNAGNWNQTDHVALPSMSRLIAVEGALVNGQPCAGILASVNDTYLVTNSLWRCTKYNEVGWTDLGYDDSGWGDAVEHGSNGNHASCSQQTHFADISSNAQWIWSNDVNDFAVYCRGYLPLCLTSSPCLNGGTCLPNHKKLCDCPPEFTGTYCESLLLDGALVITAYVNVLHLYIDGEQQTLINGDKWNQTDQFQLATTNRLIAVETAGDTTCGGLLASFGDSVLTNSQWRCSGYTYPLWWTLGFDDSVWENAVEFGSNVDGHTVCSNLQVIPDISPYAMWIWVADQKDKTIFCRGYMPVCDSSPCLNGGTCLQNDVRWCICPPRFTGTFCETETVTTAYTTKTTTVMTTAEQTTYPQTTEGITTDDLQTTEVTTLPETTQGVTTTEATTLPETTQGVTTTEATTLPETTQGVTTTEATTLPQTTQGVTTTEATTLPQTTQGVTTDNMQTTDSTTTTTATTTTATTSAAETTLSSTTVLSTTETPTTVFTTPMVTTSVVSTTTTTQSTESVPTTIPQSTTTSTTPSATSLPSGSSTPNGSPQSSTTTASVHTTFPSTSFTGIVSTTYPGTLPMCTTDEYCNGPFEKPGANIEHCACPADFLNVNNNCCMNQNWIIGLTCMSVGILLIIFIIIIICLCCKDRSDSEIGDDVSLVDSDHHLGDAHSVDLTYVSEKQMEKNHKAHDGGVVDAHQVKGADLHAKKDEHLATENAPRAPEIRRPSVVSGVLGLNTLRGHPTAEHPLYTLARRRGQPAHRSMIERGRREDFFYNPLMVELLSNDIYKHFRPSLGAIPTNVDYSIQRPEIELEFMYNELYGSDLHRGIYDYSSPWNMNMRL